MASQTTGDQTRKYIQTLPDKDKQEYQQLLEELLAEEGLWMGPSPNETEKKIHILIWCIGGSKSGRITDLVRGHYIYSLLTQP